MLISGVFGPSPERKTIPSNKIEISKKALLHHKRVLSMKKKNWCFCLPQNCQFLCSSTGNPGPGGLPGELPELWQNQFQSESDEQKCKISQKMQTLSFHKLIQSGWNASHIYWRSWSHETLKVMNWTEMHLGINGYLMMTEYNILFSLYDARVLATLGKIIVVTFNYRIGVLGENK